MSSTNGLTPLPPSPAQEKQAPVHFPSILNRPIRECQSCIPARGWQVGSCDARAVHSFRWHSANICAGEAARLCLFFFARAQWKTDSQADRKGERWASDQAELKAFTVSLWIRGSLTCQFQVWLIAQKGSLLRKQLVFPPAELNL